MYGLAVEHTRKDLTVWSGERGKTYFYQSELPYGANHSQWGSPGYVGYRVTDAVREHDAWAVGVYTCFDQNQGTVHSESAIGVPKGMERRFRAPFVVKLQGSGVVDHVINDYGIVSNAQADPSYWCDVENQKTAPETIIV